MILKTPVAELRQVFAFPETPNLRPRYNIAPTQDILLVRAEEDGRHLAMVRWGLVPHWAKDPSIGSRMINARAESVAEKPAFRSAFRRRRGLVPIDGFYEWKALDGGKRKQPYLIRRRDGAPFALAGLWERWTGAEAPLETATVITTTANATLSGLHDRMPVILSPADRDLWLDLEAPLPMIEALLRPAPDDELEAYPVGTRVNSVRNDDEACLVHFDAPPTLL